MKFKPVYLLPLTITFVAYIQLNELPTQQANICASTSKPTYSNIKIAFNHTTGNYPVFDDGSYKTINDDIAKLIQGLVGFDKDNIGGVHSLNYSIINHDDKLAIIIDYSVSDMTSRYFQKYYQLDLKTKQQILLKEYLDNHQINKINESLNQFLGNCRNSQMQTKQCDDISLGYLSNFYHFDNQKLDIINDKGGFYILDKDHIIIAFNSSKFTTSFKVNIKTYQISL